MYLDRQVSYAVDPRHIAACIADHGAEGLMFGGDWPHCEGYRRPYEGYQELVGVLPREAAEMLFGGTLQRLRRS